MELWYQAFSSLCSMMLWLHHLAKITWQQKNVQVRRVGPPEGRRVGPVPALAQLSLLNTQSLRLSMTSVILYIWGRRLTQWYLKMGVGVLQRFQTPLLPIFNVHLPSPSLWLVILWKLISFHIFLSMNPAPPYFWHPSPLPRLHDWKSSATPLFLKPCVIPHSVQVHTMEGVLWYSLKLYFGQLLMLTRPALTLAYKCE